MNKDQNPKEQFEPQTKKENSQEEDKNKDGNCRLGNTSHRRKGEYGKLGGVGGVILGRGR